MRKKDIIELKIEEMVFGGNSYGYIEEKRVDVKGGIKGQVVKCAIKKVRDKKAEAKMLEIIERSPIETEETCKHYNNCGGCSMLSVAYDKQIEIKKAQIEKLFANEKITGFEFLGVEKSPTNTQYRNKMEYTFGDEEKDGPLTLGLHKKGRSFDIITVDNCYIVDEDYSKILTTTVNYFDKTDLPYYRTMKHQGFLRNLVVRKAANTGEIFVNLVTTSQVDFDLSEYTKLLLDLKLSGSLVSILNTINDGLADAVKCDELRILHGKDHIIEKLFDLSFKISPFSFFQTNTKGAEKLYSIALDFIEDSKDKIIFDLYSGTGTIGQIVSKKAKKVYGIELIEEAVEAANENAKLNGITNCEFIAGDVGIKVKTLKVKPDIIIVDPPRPGIHKDALSDIVAFGAKEIVYISCNPVTLVRDLKEFMEAGYEVVKVKGMDMFVNTPHVETVCLITRKV